MKNYKFITAGLIALTLSSLHAEVSKNTDERIIEGSTIYGIDISAMQRELVSSGETEKIFLKQITIDGAIMSYVPSNKMNKSNANIIAIKVSRDENGGYRNSFSLYSGRSDFDYRDIDESSWIEIESFDLFTFNRVKDGFTGLRKSTIDIMNLQLRTPLYNRNGSKIFLRNKIKYGSGDRIMNGYNGEQVLVDTSNNVTVNSGIYYSDKDSYYSGIEAGVGVEANYANSEGIIMPEYQDQWQEITNNLLAATDEYNANMQNYYTDKERYESEENNGEYLTTEEYLALTNIAQPTPVDASQFDRDFLRQDLKHKSANAFAFVKYSKYLPKFDTGIVFTVQGTRAIVNEVDVDGIIHKLHKENRVNLGLEVKF